MGGISAQEGRGPKDPSERGEGTQGPWRRGATVFCRLSRQLLVPIPQRPQQELDKLRLEEGEPPREAAVEPEPERQEELRVGPSAKKDKRLKSENTKSDTLGSNHKGARVRARTQLQMGYPPQAETVQSGSVLHGVDFSHGTFSTAWWSFQLCSPENEYGDASSLHTAEGDLAGSVRRIWLHLRLVGVHCEAHSRFCAVLPELEQPDSSSLKQRTSRAGERLLKQRHRYDDPN